MTTSLAHGPIGVFARIMFIELAPFSLAVVLALVVGLARLRRKQPESWQGAAGWSACPLVVPIAVLALIGVSAAANKLEAPVAGPLLNLLLLFGWVPLFASLGVILALIRSRRGDPLLVLVVGVWSALAAVIAGVSMWGWGV